jgi:predicted type IV restriction endonuclease
VGKRQANGIALQKTYAKTREPHPRISKRMHRAPCSSFFIPTPFTRRAKLGLAHSINQIALVRNYAVTFSGRLISIALLIYTGIDMVKVSKKVVDRISANLKTYQQVAASHKTRDVSEADTVTLVKDILADCFGFDKYQELTSEQQIRGTFCDLAVKVDGKIKYLIEVKAAGVSLNDSHLRQAVGYGANEGIEWVVLTNAIEWRLHRIKFGQPIDHEEISAFNLLEVNPKKDEDIERMFLLCKEGIGADAMDAFHQHAQIINKFTIAQVLLTESVVSAVRKEIKKYFPEVKFEPEHIVDILNNDVLKREVIEGERAKETQQKLKKLTAKFAREQEKKKELSIKAGGDTTELNN